MTNLHIKFVNDITFKWLHDLIMEYNPKEIVFEESFDDIDLNQLYYYGHLLNYYAPEIELIYYTYREKYPITELSAEFALRDIPFNKVFNSDFKLIYERI